MNDMKVKDVMTNLVVMLYPSDTLQEASRRLARNRVSGAPVVVDGKVVGVVSESDLIHASMPPVQTDHGMSPLEILALLGRARTPLRHHGITIGEVMSPHAITVGADASIWSAAHLMERHGIKRLPVTDDEGCLLGIVSRADLVRAMARDDTAIRADVMDQIEVIGSENFDELEVTIDRGVVTIKGEADRLSTKRLAIDLAGRIPGVIEVIDRLRHRWDDTAARLERPTPMDMNDPLALGLVVRRGEK